MNKDTTRGTGHNTVPGLQQGNDQMLLCQHRGTTVVQREGSQTGQGETEDQHLANALKKQQQRRDKIRELLEEKREKKKGNPDQTLEVEERTE